MVDEQDNIMIHQNDAFMPKEDDVSNMNEVMNLASKDVVKQATLLPLLPNRQICLH